jgi:general secretion pathway protein D
MHGALRSILLTTMRIGVVSLYASGTWAQSTTTPTVAAAISDDELISLNFPDNVELKTLIEYVSDRLSLNILYDEQIVSQRLTIKTPAEIPKSSLLGLLESALKMKGLALVDGDQRGWKRVIAATGLIQTAKATTQPAVVAVGEGNQEAFSTVVTQIFPLNHGDPTKAESVIKPFLSQPGGNSLALPDQHLLIVTDFESNLPRISQLLRLVDQPQRSIDVRFIALQHVDAGQLATQVNQLLATELKQSAIAGSTGPQELIDVTPEPRTNRVVLIGPAELIDQTEALIKQIDVPVELQTRFYQLKTASPDRIDRLAKELVKPMDIAKVYQSVVDKDGNLLIVTGTPQMQQKVADLVAQMDVAVASEQSPLRFYKLMNTTAADALETIQAIAGEEGSGGGGEGSSRPISGASGNSGTTMAAGQTQLPQPQIPGANRPPVTAGQQPYTPPIYQDSSQTGVSGASGMGTTGGNGLGGVGVGTINPTGQSAAPATGAGATNSQPRQTLKTKDAIVTADPNTNSIIVVASPAIQSFYEQMIKQLDKRRPQVLLECTIVTLDTTNDFSLGVELGGNTNIGASNLVTFSSFGLSTPNPSNGQLALIPGSGFNAALLKPDVGSIVVRALADSGHSNVVSAPKVLVNDNATGTLSSVAEAPFTSVNASQTVSTTSFAGYASAGTTITITPHISEGDHLNLEYSVSLNSFTGDGSEGIPPPRQTDSVTSVVTIPDGEVIVVGGLNRKNFSQSQSGIPVLRKIPLLGYLFSNNSKTDENTTLFVFIRPVILRDDQFQDLKYYSQRDAGAAQIDGGLPQSQPLLVQ